MELRVLESGILKPPAHCGSELVLFRGSQFIQAGSVGLQCVGLCHFMKET